MNLAVHGAAAESTHAAVTAAAVTSSRRWSVVNLDRQHEQTVLVTRWRWYATWWAASLRIFDGDDTKIVRTGQPRSPRTCSPPRQG